jgi:hypothetical protein
VLWWRNAAEAACCLWIATKPIRTKAFEHGSTINSGAEPITWNPFDRTGKSSVMPNHAALAAAMFRPMVSEHYSTNKELSPRFEEWVKTASSTDPKNDTDASTSTHPLRKYCRFGD